MIHTDFTLDNGDKVKSLTTGFDGMITARADHLHGCNRYMVQPFMGKDKKLPDNFSCFSHGFYVHVASRRNEYGT